MEHLIQIISNHAHHAHWFIFAAIILAGFNLPLSIDAVALIAALLASQVVPENTAQLFCSLLFGCLISAWVSYTMGRLLGPKLVTWPFFAKLFPPERMKKIHFFYQKHGLLTLLIGRFIPFGVRNCLFMSAGMSQIPFKKFALRDLLACTLWCTVAFSLFYSLGQNFEILSQYIKTFNYVIFCAFSVTVIGIIWYKKRKPTKSKALESDTNH